MRIEDIKVGTILTDDAKNPETAFNDIEVLFISKSENTGDYFYVLKFGDGSLITYDWNELEIGFTIYVEKKKKVKFYQTLFNGKMNGFYTEDGKKAYNHNSTNKYNVTSWGNWEKDCIQTNCFIEVEI